MTPKLQIELDVQQMVEDHLYILEVPTRQMDAVRDAIMHDLKPLLLAAEAMSESPNAAVSDLAVTQYLVAKAILKELNV